MFGAYAQSSPVSGLLTLPEIVWEASLGIYLTVRGFRPAASTDDVAQIAVQQRA
jgi:hypothetical protein